MDNFEKNLGLRVKKLCEKQEGNRYKPQELGDDYIEDANKFI